MLDVVLILYFLGLIAIVYGRMAEVIAEKLAARWPRLYQPIWYMAATVGALAWWAGVVVLDDVVPSADVWVVFGPLVWMTPGNIGIYRGVRWHLGGKARHAQARRERQVAANRLNGAIEILESFGCQVQRHPRWGWYEVDHHRYNLPAITGIHEPDELIQVAAVVRAAEIQRQLQPVLKEVVVYLDRDEPEPGWFLN